MDITPDKGDEMARSSSTLSIGPISSKAEREDKIEEKKGSAQIALDDSEYPAAVLDMLNTMSEVNMLIGKIVFQMKYPLPFKGRKSHYSLHYSQRVYLPEDLNVKIMFNMFLQQNPKKKVSYKTYRTIFVTKFNISFVYLRTDTCSACDEHKAKKMSIENDLSQEARLSRLETEHKLHLLKAEMFYKRKRAIRLNSQKRTEKGAIAMDF
ncbi:unnamed protein product [Psylliodes chrysocephalus]|uniref:Uncharacterized protein n=1 Tax=Psylliodes chrysocephalus TaxID=3402493 RepID=A0A9P0D830_9CUCU|nr:unnamed protein product [Psylliodes chrysocephala]